MNLDPVRMGLVTSLARPGGNLTGVNFFSAELAAKRLDLLRELVPTASRVAVLLNPDEAAIAAANLRDVKTAAAAMTCKFLSSPPAPAAKLMPPSQRSRASGPTPYSSAVVRSLPAVVSS